MKKSPKKQNLTSDLKNEQLDLNSNPQTPTPSLQKTIQVSYSKRAVLGVFEASMNKSRKKALVTFFEGFLGGLFIAIGYIGSIFAIQEIDATGAQLLTIGVVFSIAIMLITFVGGCLYTSNCLGFLNVCLKNVKLKSFLKNLAVAYGGNLAGTFFGAVVLLLMGFVIPLYGQTTIDENAFAYEASDVYLHKIWTLGTALQASNLSATQFETLAGSQIITTIDAGMIAYVFFANLFSGIFCNILIAGTLYITYATKNAIAVAFVLLFTIIVFVAGGFQHSVANAFLFWLNLFQGTSNALLYQANSIEDHLTGYISVNEWSILFFFCCNLIPCIIGNFIGGGIVLPFILYGIYKKDVKQFSKELLTKKSQNIIDSFKKTLQI